MNRDSGSANAPITTLEVATSAIFGKFEMIIHQSAFRATPFHNETSKSVTGAIWYNWGDYVVPDVYTSLSKELRAIRQSAALCDMSPLPKFRIIGSDALEFVNLLTTKSILNLDVGRCLYTPWCDDDGFIVGDGLVLRLSAEEYIISGENSLLWFRSQIKNLKVEVSDCTDDFGILALQGPNSTQIIESAVDDGWEPLSFSQLRHCKIAGISVFVLRQGFTGEMGYEIWTPVAGGCEVWRTVMQKGLCYDAIPAGEYAIDVARVEAGLILVSADYHGAGPDTRTARNLLREKHFLNPFEAGLQQHVSFQDPSDFLGKNALQHKLDCNDVTISFYGLRLDRDAVDMATRNSDCPGDILSRVYWGSTSVFSAGSKIGRASSICASPSTNGYIAFGFLENAMVTIGQTVSVELPNLDGRIVSEVPAKITDTPFVIVRRS